ncbi:membrane-spanning 4-domains subfamily A member 18-like [Trichosurus vulpecula]|uniref:membrane-spanning 4-domains subfamily A member 18-like n=1 Tax=Trichosurus vulpecula TaxID=9337 RepID=UPI00186B00CD|nr:membrane-spanning 4-domains subfamily A member 18-like [Trichosurus vulpecula]
MASPRFEVSGTSAAVISDNMHVTRANHPVVSGGYGQDTGVTGLQVPASVMQPVRGAPSSPRVSIGFQNPPGMSHLSKAPAGIQNPSVVIQNPVGMVNSQTPPTGALNVTGTTTPQDAPMVNQNPTMLSPGTTYTADQPPWSISFGHVTSFDLKKFVNEEVKPLGQSISCNKCSKGKRSGEPHAWRRGSHCAA